MKPSLTFPQLLALPDATASALITALTDEWGLGSDGGGESGLADMDPETVRREIRDVWKVDPPEHALDRIQAMLAVMTGPEFRTSPEAFLRICDVLGADVEAPQDVVSSGTDFEGFPEITVIDAALTVAEAALMDPEAVSGFSGEVGGLVAALLAREGFDRPPRILRTLTTEVPLDDEDLQAKLALDGNDFAAWTRRASERRLAVDRRVRERLLRAVGQVSALKLRHARPEAVAGLLDSVSRALGTGLNAPATR